MKRHIIEALLLKRYGAIGAVMAIKIFVIGLFLLLPVFVVTAMMPSFVGNQEASESAYLQIVKTYQDVATHYWNEYGVMVPVANVMALDMITNENDFSMISQQQIMTQAKLFLQQEQLADSVTEQATTVWRVLSQDEQQQMLIQHFPEYFDATKTRYPSDAEIQYSYYQGLTANIQTLVFANQQYPDTGNQGGSGTGQGESVAQGTFILPIDQRDQPRLTVGWGLYDPFDTGQLKFHQAVDWAGVGRARILATAAGTITKTVSGCVEGDFSCGNGFGNHVVITHEIAGKKYQSIYGHLRQVTVKQGTAVKQGQIIGEQGNTGASNGAHLHFELHQPQFQYRIDSHTPAPTALNPLLWITHE